MILDGVPSIFRIILFAQQLQSYSSTVQYVVRQNNQAGHKVQVGESREIICYMKLRCRTAYSGGHQLLDQCTRGIKNYSILFKTQKCEVIS